MADLRELTEADLDAVQALIERCGDHYVLTTGAGPKATAARDNVERAATADPTHHETDLGRLRNGPRRDR